MNQTTSHPIDALESVQRITDFDKRHDPTNHVIRDVKILGSDSTNRRRYTARAVARVADLAEGAMVCIDHPPADKIAQPRGFRERWGTIRNTRKNATEARGDLHYNPKHPDTESILYALRSSMRGGLSINGRLVASPSNGEDVIEDVTILRSVDLVLNPATTRDMFESEGEEPILHAKDSAESATDIGKGQLGSQPLRPRSPIVVAPRLWH